MPLDEIEIPGPWQHRHVAANGARFHVCQAGPEDGPAVVLLHGFPQFWWAWRHQLVALADAGYRAVALDLRGYGGSDKTPRGYDPFTLAGDVAGVIGALGISTATIVGSGWGGYVGWAVAVLHPERVSGVVAVSAPHPAYLLRSVHRMPRQTAVHMLSAQVPWRPERRLADPASGYLERHLNAWSATPGYPDAETVRRYQDALRLWPAPHCALEYHRWLFRSRIRDDGRRFNDALRTPVRAPALVMYGDHDPALPPPHRDRSAAHVAGECTVVTVPGGHFTSEENPHAFNQTLLDWLKRR